MRWTWSCYLESSIRSGNNKPLNFLKIVKPKFFSLGFFLYIYKVIKNKQDDQIN